ncbi:DinB family protein [Paenibacillus puerhi]|uniref:DinB family protein n=1 Tax=Paenibacillus puerhi TaxID=2692622 RepID=UPI001358FE94|nr:DinB family protein [Paenibacillus puerhi]
MNLNNAIKSVQETLDDIVDLVTGLPSELLVWKPSEEAWSIQQVVCHLEEAIPYWLQELQETLKAPAPWGRGLQHEGRLAAVASAHQRSLEEALQGLAQAKQQAADVLASVSEADLQIEAESRNPRFGTKPLSFIVVHLLVEHTATHLQQIRRNIENYEASRSTT